jgi:hypothetical protein
MMEGHKYLEQLGLTLLSFLLMAYVISVLSFIVGYSMSIMPTCLALIYALVYYVCSVYRYKKEVYKSLVGLGVLTSIVLILCKSFSGVYDFSFDGQTYHGFGIYYMVRHGFNPYHQYVVDKEEFWFFYYPKAYEILSAAISYIFSNLEVGKVSTAMFAIVSFLLSTSLLIELSRKFKFNLSLWLILLLSYFVTFNPLILSQILTNYVDAQLFLLVLIVVILCVKNIIIDQSKVSYETYFLIFLSIIYAINIKFTGGLWVLVFLFGVLANCYYQRIVVNKKLVAVVALSFIIAILVFGYNPYVLNVRNHGYLFYPINILDIMTDNTPIYFRNHNRFTNFLIGTLAPVNNFVGGSKDLNLIIILHAYKFYHVFPPLSDNRINGVGPFFVIAFYTALSAFIIRLIKANQLQANKVVVKQFFGVLIVILISLFITPYVWWFRYVPYYYMIPILWVIYDSINKDQLNKISVAIIIFMLLLNNMLVLYPCIHDPVVYSKLLHQFFDKDHYKYIFRFKVDNKKNDIILNEVFLSQRLDDFQLIYSIDNSLNCADVDAIKSNMVLGCYKRKHL